MGVYGAKHHFWKGDEAGEHTKRDRARRMWPCLFICDLCNKKAIDRHHIDGDPGHNERNNVLFLCRSCHMKVDGRMKNLEFGRGENRIKPPSPCKICGQPSKPLRKGLCHKCNEYLRRNGFNRNPECHLKEKVK